MNRTAASSGWSSPQIIIAVISLFMATGGSYLALQRNDTAQVRAELNVHARQLAIIETKLDMLLSERAEERRRHDRRADE